MFIYKSNTCTYKCISNVCVCICTTPTAVRYKILKYTHNIITQYDTDRCKYSSVQKFSDWIKDCRFPFKNRWTVVANACNVDQEKVSLWLKGYNAL